MKKVVDFYFCDVCKNEIVVGKTANTLTLITHTKELYGMRAIPLWIKCFQHNENDGVGGIGRGPLPEEEGLTAFAIDICNDCLLNMIRDSLYKKDKTNMDKVKYAAKIIDEIKAKTNPTA